MSAIRVLLTGWSQRLDGDRAITNAINGLRDGKSANTGSVTLAANQATTTLTDARIGADSILHFMPTTANAATEFGAGSIYVSARGTGTATITHANNAQTDRSFDYTVTG